MDISKRLGELLQASGRNMSELGRYCSVSPQAARGWLSGASQPRSKKLAAIAEFFGMSVPQLLFPQLGEGSGEGDSAAIDIAPVPLLSLAHARAWCDAPDPYDAKDAEVWLACPVKHGPRTFAFRVRGQSMCAPGAAPSFDDGDIIFCDPSVETRHKSLVVVSPGRRKEAVFQRLLLDGEARFLEYLNPAWPDRISNFPGKATICGVAIARLQSFV